MHLIIRKIRTKLKKMAFLAAFLFATAIVDAQNSRPWSEYLEELNSTEDFESVDWEQYEDFLSELAENPLNLNTASREDLEQLPFLTAQQIEDIQAYIYQYGTMKSLGELAMIESIGWSQRKLLGYFVYAGDVKERTFPSLKDISRYGKQELTGMISIPFYERKGDRSGYAGYPYKHWLRYQFHYSDFVKFGLVGSQDAGEPFFANKNPDGYDYYSFFFQLKKLGWLRNLTLGRYRLHFGMGLVLNNDFGFGKQATLSTLGRSSNNIRTHSSRSSANYLQGVATTFQLASGLDLSAFVSYRKIDATLSKDGSEIQTIVKTGYHRTLKELEKKNDASQVLAGGNLNYFLKGFHVGTTAFYTSLDKPLKPKSTQLYKYFAPEGKRFWNASIDYGYLSRRLNVSGETATGSSRGIATINSISYLFPNDLSLMALQRFYSCRYSSLFSSSFSEGGSVQDESGIYLGADWNVSRHLQLKGYTDYAYFAWPKYRVSESSIGWDNFLSATILYNRWNFFTSYRYKLREMDSKKLGRVAFTRNQRFRVSAGYEQGGFSSKMQLDISHYQFEEESFGYMLSQNLRYKLNWWQVNGSLGYFHTNDYDSRVYAYEPGMLYNISFLSFYGEGIRYALSARTEIGKHFVLIAKLGTTDYFDRNKISNSYQRINRSSKTDLELQLKMKL